MFQFADLPLSCIPSRYTGFPIRISVPVTVMCTLTQLFAAYHVPLRLVLPRHPPCALIAFIFSSTLALFHCNLFYLLFISHCPITKYEKNRIYRKNIILSISLLRKEVIHPHLPVRIPCYDFTPITVHTLGTFLLAVRPVTSGAKSSRGVTGGVYKTRERIHRSIADLRLLAIPTS